MDADELNLDELDTVAAWYSDAQTSLQQRITTLEGYLKNPNNSAQERKKFMIWSKKLKVN